MAQINKGAISTIDGNMARVVPADAGEKSTSKLVIPWHLRGKAGNLSKGTPVVYVEFDDATGLILGRVDGEWGATLDALAVTILSAIDDVTAGNISLKNHVHGGVDTGSGTTSQPK